MPVATPEPAKAPTTLDALGLVLLQQRLLLAVQQHARQGLLPAVAEQAGLPADEFEALCGQVAMPVALHSRNSADNPALLPALVQLLWNHRSLHGPWTRLMAGVLASAAFGSRHLWQDLGAQGRHEVSALLQQHFRPLFDRNVRDLKWKKHFFECLGAELGQPALRPPRCGGCDEQARCFPAPAEVPVALPRPRG